MNLQDLSALTGIIVAIVTGVYFIVKAYKTERTKNWKKFENAWSNEGDVRLSRHESHLIYLELNVDHELGEVTGLYEYDTTKSAGETLALDLCGKLKFKSSVVTLTNEGATHPMEFVKVRLTLKGRFLHWKLLKVINGNEADFPKKATLFQARDEVDDVYTILNR